LSARAQPTGTEQKKAEAARSLLLLNTGTSVQCRVPCPLETVGGLDRGVGGLLAARCASPVGKRSSGNCSTNGQPTWIGLVAGSGTCWARWLHQADRSRPKNAQCMSRSGEYLRSLWCLRACQTRQSRHERNLTQMRQSPDVSRNVGVLDKARDKG